MNKFSKHSKISSLTLVVYLLFQISVFADQTNEEAQGKIEYMNNCAVCHGIEGKGDGPYAKQLKKSPSNLTILSKNNGGAFTETVVYQLIDGRRVSISDEGRDVEPFHGPRDMPIWGDVFRSIEGDEGAVDDRISNLLDYIESIQVE